MIGALLFSVGIGYFYSLPFCSVLQGCGYRIGQYFRRAKRYIFLSLLHFVLFSVPLILAQVYLKGVIKYVICFIVYVITSVVLVFLARFMRVRVTVTNRLVRLLIGTVILDILLCLPTYGSRLHLISAVQPALIPVLVPLASLILAPFEKRNNRRYIEKASIRLLEVPNRIGITGSYGKTTVKMNLDHLLSVKYVSVATPASFNTPLGIARTVENMNYGAECFIAEMGARRKGDIAELVRMVSPTVGVITGIAPQHLETFGSIEAVMREKAELALGISDGKVYYNLANDYVRRLYQVRMGEKIGVGYRDAEAIISNVAVSLKGTTYTLTYQGMTLELSLPLLGRAAVEDYALAAVIALDFGVSPDDITRIGKSLPVVPHRAEVIRQGGVTIIDDSYNINPVGAAAAIDTLRSIPAKRKMIYTCGMVELGKDTIMLNRKFGGEIAEVCDIAFVQKSLYGDEVVRGIELSNRPVEIYRVSDTEQATKMFEIVVRNGDMLLLTADLPQDYLL